MNKTSLVPKNGFVNATKNKAYFKKLHVKFKRRRDEIIDYYAMRILVFQDKNKCNTLKYHMVIHFTNKNSIWHIAYALSEGDVIMCAGYSPVLPP